MSNPFDYITNISTSTKSIWDGELSEKEYTPFIVNRGLSQFYDTVLFAQEMNQRSGIPGRWQYDFYRLGIEHKKKRFAKWNKPEKLENIDVIAHHYQINRRDVEQYLALLNTAEIDNIMDSLSKGGRNAKST